MFLCRALVNVMDYLSYNGKYIINAFCFEGNLKAYPLFSKLRLMTLHLNKATNHVYSKF